MTSARIRQLEAMLNEKKHTVLYVVEDEKTALFRYQCENVIEAAKKSKKWNVAWVRKSEISEIKQYLDRIEMVVILRQAAKDRVILELIDEVKNKGKIVLFDIDDLVFDYKDLSTLMKSIGSKNYLYYLGYFWGVRRIAKKVDGFIVTNEFLGEKIKQSFEKPYGVIPNSLNEKQVNIADECIKEKTKKQIKTEKIKKQIKTEKIKKQIKTEKIKKVINTEDQYVKKEQGNEFKIGYFSGSPTHAKDFELIEPQILQFLDKYEDANLEIVGYMKLSEKMQEYEKKGRIKISPVIDYLSLERKIAGVDVNIAPLMINDFTNCKSELKFFEAGVVETTTIASPTYVFKKCIQNGENGMLAKPKEWYDKLKYLYQHPEENRQMAKKARKDVLSRYYGKSFLEDVERVYDEFLEKEN